MLPDWALVHKAKNVEVRNIRGRFYLYRVGHKWDPVKKQTRKLTLEMLGVVTEKDGLIPKGQSRLGRPPKEKKPISNKEFGATNFLYQNSDDIISCLKELYPDHWQTIFVLSANRLMYQASLKRSEIKYETSFLSETMKEANLEKNHLTKLLREIGNDREKIVNFLSRFIEGAKHILFDTIHLITKSKNIDIAHKGYNGNRSYDPQVNLFYMFSVDKQMPTYYRVFPGNISGTKALKNCLNESELKDCIAIGDKAFYSKKNLLALKEAGLKYILPLKRDSSLIDYSRLESRKYKEAHDSHFLFGSEVVCYTNGKTIEEDVIILFKKNQDEAKEKDDNLKRIIMEKNGNSMERQEKRELGFGTIALMTNCLDKTPEEIYRSYKTRMEIEMVFDAYKNVLDADRSYMQTKESMEGWIFINHISTMMYYKILKQLRERDMLDEMSPKDVLDDLVEVRKLKSKQRWELSEITHRTEKMMKKLDLQFR